MDASNLEHLEPETGLEEIKAKWLSAFLQYYIFTFLWFIGNSFIVVPTIYELALWLFPIIQYIAFKRSSIYWFGFYTGIAPLGFVFGFLRDAAIVMRLKDSVVLPFLFCIETVFLLILIGMSFRLLQALSERYNQFYETAIPHLWIVSLFVYNGLLVAQEIKDLIDAGTSDAVLIAANLSAILCAKFIFFLPIYYFVIRRKSNLALVLVLFAVPMPFLGNAELGVKIAWFGYYTYLCISSYRLYSINLRSKTVVEKQAVI